MLSYNQHVISEDVAHWVLIFTELVIEPFTLCFFMKMYSKTGKIPDKIDYDSVPLKVIYVISYFEIKS